jgi:hypothetical protein
MADAEIVEIGVTYLPLAASRSLGIAGTILTL